MKKEIAIKIGGEAGFGIKSSGLIFVRTLFNLGFDIFGYSEYPSLIRGGHNSYQLNIGREKVFSATEKIDILIALNEDTVERHKKELKKNGIIIHDGIDEMSKIKNIINIDIPLNEFAKKAGNELARNMVALGGVMAIVGLDLENMETETEKEFQKKGKKVIDINKKAVRLGYDFVVKNKMKSEFLKLDSDNKNNLDKNDFIMTANEATAMGAIQAECKFYSAYPMTPATSIMHVLASKQKEAGLIVHQTEDEISAIGAAIGAATTGLRSATGTSGGGFALMTETLGLAAITETPLVIIESQRTAPATGLPTWTEQGDLKFVVNASHGEFPRIVMAPGDAEESFYMIQNAFNLAEKFQIPVIFLLDKFLSESDYTLDDLNFGRVAIKREGFVSDNELDRMLDFKRYRITASGISKRSVPGQKGGEHVINSDDHDEYGFSTEISEKRIKMMDKRFSKVKLIENELPEPTLYGDKNAKLTIVGWGSVKGPVLDAIKYTDVSFLHLSYVWPFPKKRVKAILEKAKNVLLVENNKTGQLGEIIRQETGMEIKNQFLKYDGRPFFREEIEREIKKFL